MPHLSSHFSLKVGHSGGTNHISIQIESDPKEHTEDNSAKVREALVAAIPHFFEAVESKKLILDIKLVHIESLPRTPRGKVSQRMLDERSS